MESKDTFFLNTIPHRHATFDVHQDWLSESLHAKRIELQKREGVNYRYKRFGFAYWTVSSLTQAIDAHFTHLVSLVIVNGCTIVFKWWNWNLKCIPCVIMLDSMPFDSDIVVWIVWLLFRRCPPFCMSLLVGFVDHTVLCDTNVVSLLICREQKALAVSPSAWYVRRFMLAFFFISVIGYLSHRVSWTTVTYSTIVHCGERSCPLLIDTDTPKGIRGRKESLDYRIQDETNFTVHVAYKGQWCSALAMIPSTKCLWKESSLTRNKYQQRGFVRNRKEVGGGGGGGRSGGENDLENHGRAFLVTVTLIQTIWNNYCREFSLIWLASKYHSCYITALNGYGKTVWKCWECFSVLFCFFLLLPQVNEGYLKFCANLGLNKTPCVLAVWSVSLLFGQRVFGLMIELRTLVWMLHSLTLCFIQAASTGVLFSLLLCVFYYNSGNDTMCTSML